MPIQLQPAPGTSTAIAGFTASGKSQFLFHLAVDQSQRGQRVQYWTADYEPRKVREWLVSFGADPSVDVVPITGSVFAKLAPTASEFDLILVDDTARIPLGFAHRTFVGNIVDEVKNIVDTVKGTRTALVMSLDRRRSDRDQAPNMSEGVNAFFNEFWWIPRHLHAQCVHGTHEGQAFDIKALVPPEDK